MRTQKLDKYDLEFIELLKTVQPYAVFKYKVKGELVFKKSYNPEEIFIIVKDFNHCPYATFTGIESHAPNYPSELHEMLALRISWLQVMQTKTKDGYAYHIYKGWFKENNAKEK